MFISVSYLPEQLDATQFGRLPVNKISNYDNLSKEKNESIF